MQGILPNPAAEGGGVFTLLDGALGTELVRQGLAAGGRAWSAHALTRAPDRIAALHRAYAEAGATVHTANTFRTTRFGVGDEAEALTRLAVELARRAVPAGHRVAGSLAPARDCWRPADRPDDATARAEHAEHTRHLVDAGVDLVLCETFADPGETRIAVEAALEGGVEVWVALTAGYRLDLSDPPRLAALAREVAQLGATRVLVNCVPAVATDRFVAAVAEALAGSGVPLGVYANAGDAADAVGWGAADGPRRYATLALRWADLGATAIGGCCGTGPAHVAAVRQVLSAAGYRAR